MRKTTYRLVLTLSIHHHVVRVGKVREKDNSKSNLNLLDLITKLINVRVSKTHKNKNSL